MRRRIQVILAAAFAAVILASYAHADGVRENRLFVSEFASFAQDRLGDEPLIRKKLDAFILANKDKLKDGFGRHPELIPEMYELAGMTRMNCIQGRYYDELNEKLNNEERHLFYEVAQKLDWWVMTMAVEEADKLKVYNPSPPLSFRQLTDVPYYIAISIRTDINAFLGMYMSREDMEGLSYNKLSCD